MLSCNYASSFYKSRHYMVNQCIKHCSCISPGVSTRIHYALSSSSIFIYLLHHASLCYSQQGKGLSGDGSKRRWALIWREGREREARKGSWTCWTWMQTGTERASELGNQPLAVSYTLWALCALWNILLRHYSERQQKYHYDRYLLCGLFFPLILMSVPLSSPEMPG